MVHLFGLNNGQLAYHLELGHGLAWMNTDLIFYPCSSVFIRVRKGLVFDIQAVVGGLQGEGGGGGDDEDGVFKFIKRQREGLVLIQ